MNTYQKKIWTLAREVMDICDKNGVKWFVSGRSAMRACLSQLFYKSFLDFEITIEAGDALKFADAVKEAKIPDRSLESLLTNSNFPGFYFKYVDESTTLYRLNEGDATQNRGLFVTIQLLRRVNDNSSSMLQAGEVEKIICQSTYHMDEEKKIGLLRKFSYKIKKSLGGTIFSKKVFNLLVDLYSKDKASELLLKNIWDEYILTDMDIWGSMQIKEFNGRGFYVPQEEYFNITIGKDWKQYIDEIVLEGKCATMIIEGANNIASSVISYRELIPKLQLMGLNRKLYFDRKKNMEKNIQNKKMSEDARRAWIVAQRAGDYWHICDLYSGIKEKLVRLYVNNEIYELRKLLDDYDKTVRKYIGYNFLFLYDEEIFDIYLHVLNILGETSLLDRINELKRVSN